MHSLRDVAIMTVKGFYYIFCYAWHQTRLWDWCIPKDEKKGIEPIITDKNWYKVGMK